MTGTRERLSNAWGGLQKRSEHTLLILISPLVLLTAKSSLSNSCRMQTSDCSEYLERTYPGSAFHSFTMDACSSSRVYSMRFDFDTWCSNDQWCAALQGRGLLLEAEEVERRPVRQGTVSNP